MSSKGAKSEEPSAFKGTVFEKLENKLKNDINKKRNRDDNNKGDEVQKKKVKIESSKSVKSPKPKVGQAVASSKASSSSKSNGSENHVTVAGPENTYNNNKTVHIQGIPFTCTEKEVTDFFKSCGEIISVRLPKWHDSGNLKGYGHIEFKSSEGATKALELSGQYLRDRYIMVDRPMTPKILQEKDATSATPKVRPPGCRTIFIKNLPYDITEADLRTSFMVYGPILMVRLPTWGHTNNKKGIGYIEFKREDSAEIAVKKSGTLLVKDRPSIVDYETGTPKGGFKADKNAGKIQPRVIKRK